MDSIRVNMQSIVTQCKEVMGENRYQSEGKLESYGKKNISSWGKLPKSVDIYSGGKV